MDPKLKAELDEMNRLAKQIREEVDTLKRNLGLYRWIKPTVEELIKDGHTWESWYAWKPVKDVNGKWHWFKEVYRIPGNTYVDHDNWRWYHYGTMLDVLKYAN
jgi:hypothetical protein